MCEYCGGSDTEYKTPHTTCFSWPSCEEKWSPPEELDYQSYGGEKGYYFQRSQLGESGPKPCAIAILLVTW